MTNHFSLSAFVRYVSFILSETFTFMFVAYFCYSLSLEMSWILSWERKAVQSPNSRLKKKQYVVVFSFLWRTFIASVLQPLIIIALCLQKDAIKGASSECVGYPDNPLKVSWVGGPPAKTIVPDVAPSQDTLTQPPPDVGVLFLLTTLYMFDWFFNTFYLYSDVFYVKPCAK